MNSAIFYNISRMNLLTDIQFLADSKSLLYFLRLLLSEDRWRIRQNVGYIERVNRTNDIHDSHSEQWKLENWIRLELLDL